jgi:hypothetical protein
MLIDHANAQLQRPFCISRVAGTTGVIQLNPHKMQLLQTHRVQPRYQLLLNRPAE